MKNVLLLILLIPILSFTTPERSKKDLFGTWIGEDKMEVGAITFDAEGFVVMEVAGEVMGGENFEIRGSKVSLTYDTNFEVTPIRIDIVFTTLETGEQKRLPGIGSFIDDNTLNYAVGFDLEVPLEFTDENSIVLKKQKE